MVDLYSNPNEVVFSPFMGCGSDVFSPISMGRKAIGVELKDSYYKQAIYNLASAQKRFNDTKQIGMLWHEKYLDHNLHNGYYSGGAYGGSSMRRLS